MAQAPISRRGTTLPDSDAQAVKDTVNVICSTFILSSPSLGVSTGNKTYSATKFFIAATGGNVITQATVTGAGFTGINTAVTSGFVLVAVARTQAGTIINVAGTTGATSAACGMPVVPSTANAFGLMLLGGGATLFTGGAVELDATQAGAVFWNLTGPAGIAVTTAPITSIPG